MSKLLIIGLTGGIGSGKSSVAQYFRNLGVGVVDTDAIAHALTQKGSASLLLIADELGHHLLLEDGSLNRGLLRELVFNSKDAKNKLESILHPLIHLRCDELIAQEKGAYLILDVPLLIENPSFLNKVDRVLVVDVPEDIQVERVRVRNGFDLELIKAIMQTQVSRAVRLARADDVLDNTGSLEELSIQVTRMHEFYLSLSCNTKLNDERFV